MRRVLLTGSLFALLAALLLMWAYRFESVPGLPTWRLADLRNGLPPMAGVEWTGTPEQPKLRLRIDDASQQPVALRLVIPAVPPLHGLHLRFRLEARGLIPGSETWQDGRMMVEWHDPVSGPASKNDTFASIRHDTKGMLEDLIVLPHHSPAIPSLRLEHLGRSGEFELTDLVITPIHERTVWKIGRWFLALGCLAWAAALVRSWPGISRWRAMAAASIWVTMTIFFAVPGPWKIQRAMVPAFQLGGENKPAPASLPIIADANPTQNTPPALNSGRVTALGKLPDQGSFALRVKLALTRARPLLHVCLIFAPTLAFVFLIGKRPALLLSVLMVISIELAQVAFGYGFGWDDVADLTTDAIGIALALWVWEGRGKLKVMGYKLLGKKPVGRIRPGPPTYPPYGGAN